jgi:hypothetical protein
MPRLKKALVFGPARGESWTISDQPLVAPRSRCPGVPIKAVTRNFTCDPTGIEWSVQV